MVVAGVRGGGGVYESPPEIKGRQKLALKQLLSDDNFTAIREAGAFGEISNPTAQKGDVVEGT